MKYCLNMTWDELYVAKHEPKNIKLSKPLTSIKYDHPVCIADLPNFNVDHAKYVIKNSNLLCDIIGYVTTQKRLYAQEHKKLTKLIFYFDSAAAAILFRISY